MISIKCYSNRCDVLYSEFTHHSDLDPEDRGVQGDGHIVQDQTGKLFFVKTVVKRSHGAAEELARFLSPVKSPYVIRYLHCFEELSCYNFIMDFCPGGSLFRFLSSAKQRDAHFLLADDDVMSILVQVLSGLQSLHKMNVIHRDLKLANLLLESTQRPYKIKLCDFGVSKSSTGTFCNTFTGTPGYIAPEVQDNRPYSFSVDYFSLGAILYELTEGRRPFPVHERSYFTDFSVPLVFSEFNCFDDVISGLLDFNPDTRFDFNQLMRIPRIRNAYESIVGSVCDCIYVEEVGELRRQNERLKAELRRTAEENCRQIEIIKELHNSNEAFSAEISRLNAELSSVGNELEELKKTSPKSCHHNTSPRKQSNNNNITLSNNSIVDRSFEQLRESSPATSSVPQSHTSRPPFPEFEDENLMVAVQEAFSRTYSNRIEDVRYLTLHDSTPLSSLKGIEVLVNLESLKFVPHPQFESFDLTPLTKLKSLKSLRLEQSTGNYSNRIQINLEISPTSSLFSLTELFVGINSSDIRWISSFASLETLTLGNSCDLSPLHSLSKLKYLSLESDFENAHCLVNIASLRHVIIYSSSLCELPILPQLETLTICFHSSRTRIYLDKLRSFFLRSSSRTRVSLDKLAVFHNLQNLVFDGSCANEYSLMTQLPQVTSLKCRTLVDHNLLSSLVNLESLEIHSYIFQQSSFSLSSIVSPLKLSVLKVAGCVITDFSIISNFINLEELILKRCKQPDNKLLEVSESMLQPLTKLRECSINGHSIKSPETNACLLM
ncbi:hypothetical protein RCL1_009161 [Eukaryota sp. TZLM3-RCL]